MCNVCVCQSPMHACIMWPTLDVGWPPHFSSAHWCWHWWTFGSNHFSCWICWMCVLHMVLKVAPSSCIRSQSLIALLRFCCFGIHPLSPFPPPPTHTGLYFGDVQNSIHCKRLHYNISCQIALNVLSASVPFIVLYFTVCCVRSCGWHWMSWSVSASDWCGVSYVCSMGISYPSLSVMRSALGPALAMVCGSPSWSGLVSCSQTPSCLHFRVDDSSKKSGGAEEVWLWETRRGHTYTYIESAYYSTGVRKELEWV